MEAATQVTEFAPRRVRQDRQHSQVTHPKVHVIEEVKPMSDDIAKDAARFHTMVQNTIKERNDFAEKLNAAHARIEQFQITLGQRDSQITTLTLERDAAREGAIRLKALLEGLGSQIADALVPHGEETTAA